MNNMDTTNIRRRRISDVENVAAMIERKHAKKTRCAYSGRRQRFVRWIAEHESPEISSLHKDGEVTLPVPEDVLLEFFGHLGNVDIGNERQGDAMEMDVEEGADGKYKAVSTIGGYRSALVAMYKESNISHLFPNDGVSSFMAGYKRTIAEEKHAGNMSLYEGKRPVTIQTYRKLNKLTLREGFDTSEYLFNSLFLLLCWNLMSRSITIAQLKFNHISWSGDAMVVTIPKSKSDQEGENIYPKHVYANPQEPLLCPLLSLGLKIVSMSKVDKQDNTVFSGREPENKFSKWLNRVMKSLSESQLMVLGITMSELGTHSFRKGASTYAQSKSGGPSMIAVYHRAGWSIGNVQQRYIFPTEAGDQMVGRILSGLEWNNDDHFTSLPPHFLDNAFTDDEWSNIVPGFQNYPSCFKGCIPYLVASVVYHHEWLKDNLPRGHPYFRSHLFTSGRSSEVKEKVVQCSFYNAASGMTATGVPETIRLCRKIKDLERELSDLKSSIEEVKTSVRSCRDDILEKLPQGVVDAMIKKIKVDGVVPLTQDDLTIQLQNSTDSLGQFLMGKIDSRFNDMLEKLESGAVVRSVDVSNNADNNTSNIESPGSFQPFQWGGGYHFLPENYVFPPMTVKNAWDAWLYGVPCEGIPPYRRCVNSRTTIQKKSERVKYSKMKYVIECLIEATGMSAQQLSALSLGDCNAEFNCAFLILMENSNVSSTRCVELSYFTAYVLFKKKLK